jgi:poly-gamma-glutamate capsule biosynthesis protein CapA/YwtB (metallophosphatase superfamily)
MRNFIHFVLLTLTPSFLFAQAVDTVNIVAVGDMMLGTHYPSKEYLPPNEDCSQELINLKPLLQSGDVTFGNLEGVLTDSHAGAKRCNNPAVCYTFAMPVKFAACLKDAGFNLLSIANNHVGDFGEIGRASTIKALDGQKIHYAGLLSCPTDTFTIKGVKYGFCAFAPNTGTVSVKDIAAAEQIVRNLDKQCDIVIVSFHAGAEGKQYQHVTRQIETFLGENRGNVYEFAHRMIDAGGDVLLGHGPHVTRAIEVYKNRFITYSMGNFCTYSKINVNDVNGLAPVFKLRTDKNGKFLNGDIVSTNQIRYQPVQIDKEKRVLKVIQNLTKADFPEMSKVINIDDAGRITLIEL